MRPETRLVNCPACRTAVDGGVHGRHLTREWHIDTVGPDGKMHRRSWEWVPCRRCHGHGVIPTDQLKAAAS